MYECIIFKIESVGRLTNLIVHICLNFIYETHPILSFQIFFRNEVEIIYETHPILSFQIFFRNEVEINGKVSSQRRTEGRQSSDCVEII